MGSEMASNNSVESCNNMAPNILVEGATAGTAMDRLP